MNKILLSIIIPVYQVEKYIKECLDSIIESIPDNKSVEVICIDDGSVDNSGSICCEYSNKYCFIKYLKKNNEGVSKARNLGIKVAMGDYIAFVDSDDLVNREYICSAIELITKKRFDVCFFEYEDLPQKQNGYSSIRSNRELLFKKGDNGHVVYDQMMRSNIHLSNIWSSIFRKDFLVQNNIRFNIDWTSSEDVDFINSCLSVAEHVLYKNQTSIIYRRFCENSASNNMNNIKVLCDLQVRIKWYNYTTKNNIGDSDYYPNEFIDLMLKADIEKPCGVSILEYIKEHKYIFDNATSKKAKLFKILSLLFGYRLSFKILKAMVSNKRTNLK